MTRTTKNNKGTTHKAHGDVMAKTPSPFVRILPFLQKFAVPLFFIALWAVLAFYESALLKRSASMSLFLFDSTFFEGMLAVPAGMLSYLGCFFIQFFHYPALGAAIYVALLFLVYWLTRKVFVIPVNYSLLALVPVVALVASNTQLGYWLFYLKMPGYYYMALLATLLTLLGMWAYRKSGAVVRFLLPVVWVVAGYPFMGVYALVSSMLMALFGIMLAVQEKKSLLLPSIALLFAFVLVIFVPRFYYGCYNLVAKDLIYTVGVPVTQWGEKYVANVVYESESVWQCISLYWLPLCLLLLSMLLAVISPAFRGRSAFPARMSGAVNCSALLFSLIVMACFWYRDTNFRIENKQMVAMWDEDWAAVAEYAKDTDEPTRQIVLNKNLALVNMGKLGQEMFAYPDGGLLPISPISVHMTHTDGSSIYYNYGKFNYCYRWCVENSVEYGWRVEYLKNAARSMLLSGEYKLAGRYTRILKSTLFNKGWALELEKYIDNPELIAREPSFAMPLSFACYNDVLGVDEGVEVHLTSTMDALGLRQSIGNENLLALRDAFEAGDIEALKAAQENVGEVSHPYLETSMTMALIKKDSKRFLQLFDMYLANHMKGVDLKAGNAVKYLPVHYQEALLLFLLLDKGQTVQVGDAFLGKIVSRAPGGTESRFNAFQRAVATNRDAISKKYPDMSESRMNAQLATILKEEFGNTYYYYYFFVKKIKTY